jgi:iron complex transport system substrate-binding protein
VRVVAHSCSNTEIVCALGGEGLLVGCDDHSDWPPQVVAGLERVGPDLHVDVDRIAALKPDLVVYSLTVPGHERALAELKARGIPVVVLEPVSLADVWRDIRAIGAALRLSGRAEALVGEMQAAIVPVTAASRPKVLVEWWPKPVIVPGRLSWVTDLIDAAGGSNPFGDRLVKSTPIDDAEAIAAAPDAVVMAWCGVPVRKYRARIVAQRPEWQDVPAVRASRIAAISEEFLGRPGPRLVEGYRRLREVVEACVPAGG